VTATGADTGTGAVQVFDAITGRLLTSLTAYDVPGYTGGARVALGDVNGDGIPDLITAPGKGLTGGALIKVYDGAALLGGTVTELFNFRPYGTGYTGEVFVAAADFNHDNLADIVTGDLPVKGPTVKVFNAVDQMELGHVQPFGPSYKGGGRVAAGDVNGDGTMDIIAGQSQNGAQFVAISGRDFKTVLLKKTATATAIKGGVFVAAGDVNGDGKAEVIVGLGAGTSPLVQVYRDASDLDTKASLLRQSAPLYGKTFKGGVRVAAVDLDGDGKAEVLTTAGSVPPSYRLRVLNGLMLTALDAYFSQAPDFSDARSLAAASFVGLH
jgi:hypothetical protein